VIRSALLLLGALTAPAARADDAEPDDSLLPYRTPFPVLVQRSIGTASKPVEFDWRRTDVQLAATGDQVFELNNFNSLRAGGLARIPSAGVLYEIGVSYVWVWDTPSSELLARTPYRQPGRPSRLELDLTLALPVAEGVVTWFPRFFPAAEMVFNAYGGLRYVVYPQGYAHLQLGQVARAVLSPSLSDEELDNLEAHRLDAMEVDSGRYGFMVGFGNDLYFRSGVFVSPRMMFTLPLLAPLSGTDILLSAEATLAVGLAF
jgi:hypothetical protein